MLSGTLVPTAGSIAVRTARRSRGSPRTASSIAVSVVPSRSRGRFTGSVCSRTSRSPAITARAATAAPRRMRRPSARFAGRLADGSPRQRRRPRRRRLEKLELAKALATGPKLLLADESLGGLDEHEMDQAADMLRKIRDELGITIIWSSTSWAC